MTKFVDLAKQYRSIKDEIDLAINEVISNTAFIGGKYCEKFEEEFAAYHEAPYCIGVGNGTDALEIALEALELPPESEVIVPANSFIATSEAVTRAGHVPVFCDSTPGSHTLDVKDAERRITSRTSAIIPVHLYGRPCEMDEVVALAERHGLKVVEDCAQAHGALYRGRKVGTFGDAGCFSFYPGKNLGAYGDGGAIISKNDEFTETCRMLSNHGRVAKYDHKLEGRNSRLDGMQAAILSVKLRHLEEWTELRRSRAALYRECLGGSGVGVPQEESHARHVYHLFVIESSRRDALQENLKEAGIETGIHYPIPLPLLGAYAARYGRPEEFPVAAAVATRILSLPMDPGLTDAEVRQVSERVASFERKA